MASEYLTVTGTLHEAVRGLVLGSAKFSSVRASGGSIGRTTEIGQREWAALHFRFLAHHDLPICIYQGQSKRTSLLVKCLTSADAGLRACRRAGTASAYAGDQASPTKYR